MPAGVRRWYRARIIDKIGNKGDWTTFVEGQSSIDASEILGDITNQALQSEAGKQLTAKIDTSIEGILQNALDNNAIVDHQMVVNGQNRADIISVKTTIADNDHAYAQKFDQIQVTVGENAAAISEKATEQFSTDGTGSAVFSVNAGVTYKGTYYSAGMSIGVQVAGDGGVSSQVLFLADRFAMMSQAGGQTYSPFAIQNGQVFINQAFIADGTITSAKIGDYIQSNNYVANVSGWRFNKAGTLENYGSDSNGAMKQTNTTISIKDANGVLQVQIGNLTGVF